MPPSPTALPPETVGIRTAVGEEMEEEEEEEEEEDSETVHKRETVVGSETALLRETVALVAALKPVAMPLLRSVVMALVATSPPLVKDSVDLVLIVTGAKRVRRSLLPLPVDPMTPLTGARNKRQALLCTMRVYYN